MPINAYNIVMILSSDNNNYASDLQRIELGMRRHRLQNTHQESTIYAEASPSRMKKVARTTFWTKKYLGVSFFVISFVSTFIVLTISHVSFLDYEENSLNNLVGGMSRGDELDIVAKAHADSLDSLTVIVAGDPKKQIREEEKRQDAVAIDGLTNHSIDISHKIEEPRHMTLSSLGIPEKLPPEKFDKRRNTTQVSLVISYCSENFGWIFNYIDIKRYKINEIMIYSKCNNEIHNIEDYLSYAPTKVINAPNVGRCDHTYATWILEHYSSIEADKNGDDIVFFIKDNDYHRDQYYTFDELFTFTTEVGFGCAEKPVCDCDNEQCNEKKDIALMMHNQKELDNFKMNTHNRLERDKKSKQSFKNKKYRTLKDWKEDMGFQLPHSEAIPVCYGGIFAAKKKQVLNQPQNVWQNVVNSLTRGNNIIEGHFAERLWAPALSVIDEDFAKSVSEVVLAHVYDTFWCWNRKGMLMAPKSKGFDASLFANVTSVQI